MKLSLFFLALVWLSSGCAQISTVVVVRHAEKQTGADPGLTEQGQTRARHLAQLLASSDIQQVFSSDYRRTRDTAAPLLRQQALSLTVYDPRDLEGLAQRLLEQRRNVLVVGHSNTTPQLVRLLGGEAQDMEEWEYDRVYLLQLEDGAVHTRLLHLPPVGSPP